MNHSRQKFSKKDKKRQRAAKYALRMHKEKRLKMKAKRKAFIRERSDAGERIIDTLDRLDIINFCYPYRVMMRREITEKAFIKWPKEI